MPDSTLSADLRLARQLASVASDIALHHFDRGSSVELKPDGSPVSSADREIESVLVDVLQRQRPTDAVLGEELGARGTSARRWLIDPIDGTANFIAGKEQWGTHVALEVDQRVVLGIITRPRRGATWWACRGSGAFRVDAATGSEGVPLRVSTRTSLSESRVTVWARESDPVRIVLHGAAIWVEPDIDSILRLAEGELDAVVDRHGKPWDHAPLVVLVEEAGGAFSDSRAGHRIDLGEVRYTNRLIQRELDAFLARCC